MILVDTMNLHQACTNPEDIEDGPNEWFTTLAHEMINNKVVKKSKISSNTGQPRKVDATHIVVSFI